MENHISLMLAEQVKDGTMSASQAKRLNKLVATEVPLAHVGKDDPTEWEEFYMSTDSATYAPLNELEHLPQELFFYLAGRISHGIGAHYKNSDNGPKLEVFLPRATCGITPNKACRYSFVPDGENETLYILEEKGKTRMTEDDPAYIRLLALGRVITFYFKAWFLFMTEQNKTPVIETIPATESKHQHKDLTLRLALKFSEKKRLIFKPTES